MNWLKNKKISTIRNIIIICVMFSLAACTNNSNNNPSRSQNQGVVVVDCIGRTVQVPHDPQRIACLSPDAGHAVAMMGKGDKIVAVVDGLQRDKIMTSLFPNVKEASLPKVGGFINIEELLACNPDLVFIKGDEAMDQGQVAKLDSSGLTYLVVSYTNMEEQLRAMDMMGKAVGNEAQALKYRQYYQACLERVSSRVEPIAMDKRVRVYHSVNEATRTDVKGTLPADVFKAAGVLNVSLEVDNLRFYEGKYYASLEQILLWNPDAILCSEPGVAAYIKDSQQWSTLSAVNTGKVYQMPNGISRWGHPTSLETPLALLWVAKTTYPELFVDVDMASEVKNFLREFLHLEISDEQVKQILNGTGMRLSKQGNSH